MSDQARVVQSHARCQSLWPVSPTCTHLSWPCHELHSGLCIPLAPTCPGLDISFPLDLFWPSHCLPDTMAYQQQIAEKFWPREGQFIALPCMSAVFSKVWLLHGHVLSLTCLGLQSCSCMPVSFLVLAMLACTPLALILQCCFAQPLPGSCLHSPCLARIFLLVAWQCQSCSIRACLAKFAFSLSICPSVSSCLLPCLACLPCTEATRTVFQRLGMNTKWESTGQLALCAWPCVCFLRTHLQTASPTRHAQLAGSSKPP